MKQKSILTFIFSMIIFFSLNSVALANKDKLVGNWKGTKVSLNIKANNTYIYKVKGFKFSGSWSATNNKLTLNYKFMGISKSRKSTYSFKDADLVLSSDKGDVVLKKQ